MIKLSKTNCAKFVGISFLIFQIFTFINTNNLNAQILPLDPKTLVKYMDPLPIPGIMPPVNPNTPNIYVVGAYPIMQQLHSQLPPTYLFGYGTSQQTASYPAATFEVLRNAPIDVTWTNNLVSDNFPIPHPLAVDNSIPIAITNTGIPITTHVHGAEVEPQSDGHPDSWFTPGFAEIGPGFVTQTYHYANTQPPATIWYHDHAFGYTRLNVYMGLAGFYIVRDPQNEPQNLPSGAYEIPIVIQDRMFNTDGSLSYPDVGINPTIHPFWVPEFFGNTILVNGKVWPYLNIEPRKYRFRILNGSQARFYNLSLSNGSSFMQIGTDGGYLNSPVVLNQLLLAPGERADVIIDFSRLKPGTKFLMENNAKGPYPNGAPADPQTVGQIMQFRVVPLTGTDNSVIPATLNNITPLTGAVNTRVLTLNETMGPAGPTGMYLNGKMMMDMASEMPTVGTTEIWQIVNLTMDAHPIHSHLVQFQLVNRQKFQMIKYMKQYMTLNPVIPVPMGQNTTNPPVAQYLQGAPIPPDANERGWKDTYRCNPGEVTTFIIRYTPVGTSNGTPFEFDATAHPGYVWHCHILEHEENQMMRPLHLMNGSMEPKISNNGISFTLKQNYPNPFNPITSIEYSIPDRQYVTLKVFNILGKEVATLVNTLKNSGNYSVSFNASNLSSGTYFYRLQAGNYTKTMRMIVLK